jgi:Holliday junction resolvase
MAEMDFEPTRKMRAVLLTGFFVLLPLLAAAFLGSNSLVNRGKHVVDLVGCVKEIRQLDAEVGGWSDKKMVIERIEGLLKQVSYSKSPTLKELLTTELTGCGMRVIAVQLKETEGNTMMVEASGIVNQRDVLVFLKRVNQVRRIWSIRELDITPRDDAQPAGGTPDKKAQVKEAIAELGNPPLGVRISFTTLVGM